MILCFYLKARIFPQKLEDFDLFMRGFIKQVWSLMPEKIKGNNYTSKMNVFPVSHTIFFLRGGQKMDLFAPSTLWPAGRKNGFVCPEEGNKIYFLIIY